MNKVSAVYSITNLVNGKLYIGSAVSVKDRWYRHRLYLNRGTHNCRPLQNAWNKYGSENFGFSILEIISNTESLLASEQNWLDKVKPYKNNVGYNCCPTAGSTLGIKYSDESKEKISRSTKRSHGAGCYAEKNRKQKGVAHSIEHRRKIAASLKTLHESGYKHSAERNAKISASRKGKKYPNLSISLRAVAAVRKGLLELTTI